MILGEIDNLWKTNNIKDKLRSWLGQIKLTQQRVPIIRNQGEILDSSLIHLMTETINETRAIFPISLSERT